MDFRDFTAGINDNQRRLDKVLRNFLDSSRLSEIYKLIRKGLIKVNHKKSSPEYRVNEGDIISIAAFLFENEKNHVVTVDDSELNFIKSRIVFENKHIIIINKPYNINVHGDDNSLDKLILNYYNSKKAQTSLSFTPGPLHRLDKKTTGLLAFSMSLEGARWFSENIQNHNIKKKYIGIIQGKLNSVEEWKDCIIKNDQEDGFATVTAVNKSDSDESKNAETIVTPVAYGKYKGKDITLVEFNIKTGRKHQIRAQSSLHNHPLLGDVAYNGDIINESQDFYLMAYKLEIPQNPIDLPNVISIPLSENFVTILKYCGINNIEL